MLTATKKQTCTNNTGQLQERGQAPTDPAQTGSPQNSEWTHHPFIPEGETQQLEPTVGSLLHQAADGVDWCIK